MLKKIRHFSLGRSFGQVAESAIRPVGNVMCKNKIPWGNWNGTLSNFARGMRMQLMNIVAQQTHQLMFLIQTDLIVEVLTHEAENTQHHLHRYVLKENRSDMQTSLYYRHKWSCRIQEPLRLDVQNVQRKILHVCSYTLELLINQFKLC